MTIGGMFWQFNAPGCFIWAKVLESGRVYVRADYKFVRVPIQVCAARIQQRTQELGLGRLSAIYADPEMFPKADTKAAALEPEAPAHTFARYGLPMVKSGSHREHGWQRVHEYLRDAPDGSPWLIVHPEATALLRTLPTLVKHDLHPDDCEGEEYAANALRFLLVARPSPTTIKPKPTVFAPFSLGWWKSLDAREARTGGVLAR